MTKRRLFALISTALLIGGCGATPTPSDDNVEVKKQAAMTWNGMTWNGMTWNGMTWNGMTWNAMTWNGLGFNGMTWNGMTWNGMTWNGNPNWDWGLSWFVNSTDADGDGMITNTDREMRLMALDYWTGCACPGGSHPTWTGPNPYGPPYTETRTFNGIFGLAPTWCTGAPSSVVPTSEHEAVSACLYARTNSLGLHQALSLRGLESSLSLGPNEKLFMAYASEQFWGNAWDSQAEIYDPSDGNYYKKSRANSCYFPWGNGNAQLAKDLQLLLGRSCSWDGCGGNVKTSLACLQPGWIDGSTSTGRTPSYIPIWSFDPAVGWNGTNNSTINNYQDIVTGTEFANYRGNDQRRISVFLGDWADLELENWKDPAYQCSDICAPMDGCDCYDSYCNGSHSEGGLNGGGGGIPGQPVLCERPSDCNICSVIVRQPPVSGCGMSAACAPATNCVRGRKLTDLQPGCWLQVEFMRPYDLLTNAWVSGNADTHKAGTFVFRYSNNDPGGNDASILIRDRIRGTMIDGTGFVNTGNWNNFKNNYRYPVYPARSTFSGAVPAIDVEISADPASPVFPHLDYVQMFVGPPFGVQPREMYWNDNRRVLPPGREVCVDIHVEETTDFTEAGNIRIRPRVEGVSPQQLMLSIQHNSPRRPLNINPAEPEWTEWNPDFLQDNPQQGDWTVCITSPVPAQLNAVDLEMEKH